MELKLHRCSITELDQLVLISRKTFTDAFASQNDPDDFKHYLQTALTRETIANELDHPQTSFYFVKNSKETIGFLKINDAKAQTDIFDETSYELERIYVVSGYQGLGVGEWMIDQAIRLAQEAEKDYIWLGVWEENTSAIRFYEKKGFTKFGRHPYYIGKDKQMDWLMKLDLTTL
ncbi:MAG: GNAT family N-acetyltransferase [Eudoraea sp.]|nr:GNAT family N-acetyltransferase [Eudoraea sp.]